MPRREMTRREEEDDGRGKKFHFMAKGERNETRETSCMKCKN